MKKLLLIALTTGSFSIACAAQKTAFINIEQIFQEAKPAKAITEELQGRFAPVQKQLASQQQELDKLQKRLIKIAGKTKDLSELPAYKQDEYKKIQATFQEKQASFQQTAYMMQQQGQQAQQLATGILLENSAPIIEKISKQNDYDFVLTSTQVAYANPKYNITEKVIDQLDKVNPKEMIKKINKTIDDANKSTEQ